MKNFNFCAVLISVNLIIFSLQRFSDISQINLAKIEAYPETYQTSKVEHFA